MSTYRVLVVDDNHEVRRMVTASIKTLGTEIDVLDVPSAEEALFLSASLQLDLVVLDYRLPGMSGLEMLSRLRKRTPGIKIILVTGVEDPKTRKEVSEANATAFFFKPLEISTFLEAVRRCLWPDQGVIPGITAAPGVSGEPSASGAPSVSREPTVGTKPGIGRIPGISEAHPATQVPDASGEPSTSEAPAASKKPTTSKAPAIGEAPPVSKAPSITETPSVSSVTAKAPSPQASQPPAGAASRPVAPPHFQPTIAERLTALKQQLRATSTVLLNETGQVVEKAGTGDEMNTNALLSPALMDAFRASQKVADAFGKEATESLLSFTYTKYHIYLAPVNPSHVLLVFAVGFLEPDKLGMLDRAIHLAATDLDMLMRSQQQAEDLKQVAAKPAQEEAPTEVIIDQETLSLVDEMFSKAPKTGTREAADGFWEALREAGALDGKGGEGVISYDEARDLGLPLDDEEIP